MKRLIKSWFSKQKYYVKAVNEKGDLQWLMEISDIIALMSHAHEMEVIKLSGEVTIVVGRR